MTVTSYGYALLRYRWLVLLASVASILVLACGGLFLKYEPDTRIFFSRENPHLLALEALENTYSKRDSILFALAPEDGDVFTRETLSAIAELTEAAWQIPYSRRVDSIANYQHVESVGDHLVGSSLVEDAPSLTGAEIERIRAIALASPTLVGRVIAEDGAVAGVVVFAGKPSGDPDAVLRIAAHARGLVDEFEGRYPAIDIHLTGTLLLDAAFMEVPRRDMQVLVPIMFLVIVVILGLVLRTVSGTICTLLVILMSVAGALGLAGWFGAGLNGATMAAPLIVLTLSVAHCIHVMSTMQLAMSDGSNRREAIVESLRLNMQPAFITSATTAISFLSMNFSDVPPFRALGNVSAAGIMLAFVLSVTFLPAYMATARGRVRAGQMHTRLVMERLAEAVIAKRSALFWTTGACVVVMLFGIGRITLDDNFVEYFDQRFEVRAATDFVEENLTGLHSLEYSIPAGREGGITDPAYLEDLEKLSNWYRGQPNVRHVTTFSDIIKQLHRNMHGDDPAWYRIPEDSELAAQYLLWFEMSLPNGLDLNDRVDMSKSLTRFIVIVDSISSLELRELDRRAQVWMSANTPSIQASGTGLSMIFAHLSERNVKAMLVGCAVAVVLISLILVFVFGSVRAGLVSIVPNVVPAGMAFGIWGYAFGDVGLAISTVAAITLGIVVDDTVHFLSKYLRARNEHRMDARMACEFAFGTVGPALWITSLTLVAGFAVLAFSGFNINSDIGILGAGTIALALVVDLLFLPGILTRLDLR